MLSAWAPFRIIAYSWGDLTVNGSVLLFWTFFGQVFPFRRAKRLLGWVSAGGTAACIGAGCMIKPFARVFGTANLLLIVALLMAGFAAAVFILTLQPESPFEGVKRTSSAGAVLPDQAYYLRQLKTPRIRFLALQAMVGTMVIILVDYQFKAVAQAHFHGPRLAAFFGEFYAATNIGVLLIQLFALHLFLQGKRLLTSLGILPTGMLLGGAATIFSASFLAVLATRLVAQMTQFTIDTGAFQVLYLGLKKQTQTQVRALVDGICKPAAIGITGAILVLLSGAMRVYFLSIPAVVLCLVWFYLARRNYSFYLSGLLEALHARLLEFSKDVQIRHDKSAEDFVRRALLAAKCEELPYLLNVVQRMDEVDWSKEIQSLLRRPEPEIKIAALEYLCDRERPAELSEIAELVRDPVAEVRRVAVRAARLGGGAALALLRASLEDSDPGVRAEAAAALIDMDQSEALLQSDSALRSLLESPDKSCRMAVAGPLSRLRAVGPAESLLRLLDDPEPEVRLAALRACANRPKAALVPKVITQLWDTQTSGAAADALLAFGPLTADYLLTLENTADLVCMFAPSPHLPAILERDGSPRALEVLQRVLDSAGSTASASTILAYCRILRRQASFQPYREYWESVLRCQIEALQKRRRLWARSKTLKGNAFLLGVLQEAQATHLRNVFTLLGLLAPTVKMEAILSHLESGDEEGRARAQEILEHVLSLPWRNTVLELIEAKVPLAPPASIAELLGEALASGSREPMLLGVLYAAAQDGCPETLSSVQRLLSHWSGAVRETALFALGKMAGAEDLTRQCRELLADPDESVRRLAQSMLRDSSKDSHQEGTHMIAVQKMLFLRNVPLFSKMETSELTHVASITREATFPAGCRIIQEGEHGDHMFLIVDGEVLIQRGTTPVNKLGPRDFFGEMSIIDGEPRSATATAATDCLLLRIDKDDFQELLSTYNSAAISVARALNQRLRDVLPALERAQRGM
jgi:HEAT repeat protein